MDAALPIGRSDLGLVRLQTQQRLDVGCHEDFVGEYGIPMGLSNLIDQLHVEALHRGWGPEDSDSVAKIQEEKAGVQLRLAGV